MSKSKRTKKSRYSYLGYIGRPKKRGNTYVYDSYENLY